MPFAAVGGAGEVGCALVFTQAALEVTGAAYVYKLAIDIEPHIDAVRWGFRSRGRGAMHDCVGGRGGHGVA